MANQTLSTTHCCQIIPTQINELTLPLRRGYYILVKLSPFVVNGRKNPVAFVYLHPPDCPPVPLLERLRDFHDVLMLSDLHRSKGVHSTRSWSKHAGRPGSLDRPLRSLHSAEAADLGVSDSSEHALLICARRNVCPLKP